MIFGTSGLTVRYHGTTALSDVSMTAEPGAVTMVVGGDGAGKSTLLRALAGLAAPASGSISRPGSEGIGYLPTGAGSWKNLSVDENITFVGGSYGLTAAEIRTRGDDLLERAGLTEARDRPAGKLSGGMRNKLGFCLAMLSEPDLLILDEPTTGVDPVSRVDLWRLVSEAAAGGAAVVMATTYMDEAERGTTVYLLGRGRVLVSGTPDEIVDRMPGAISTTPHPSEPSRAWRAGRHYREWWPDGAIGSGEPANATLSDAAVVAELATLAGEVSA